MPFWTFPDGSEFYRAEGSELADYAARCPWIADRIQIARQKSAEMYLSKPGHHAIYRRHLAENAWLLSFDGFRQPDFNCEVLVIVNPAKGMARERAESEFRRFGFRRCP